MQRVARSLDGLSRSEAAKRLGLKTPGAVTKRLRRAESREGMPPHSLLRSPTVRRLTITPPETLDRLARSA